MGHRFDPVGWQYAGKCLNALKRQFGPDFLEKARDLVSMAEFPEPGAPGLPPSHNYPCAGCMRPWIRRMYKALDARKRDI